MFLTQNVPSPLLSCIFGQYNTTYLVPGTYPSRDTHQIEKYNSSSGVPRYSDWELLNS